MSMPKIPDINPNISISKSDAINMIITSIAMEELALAHILNAEGEKLQYVLGTLNGRDPGEVTICDIMAVNQSVQKTLRDVVKAEMLLQLKLEDAVELNENATACQLSVTGQKIWRDNNNVDGKRPDTVDITLLRNGVAVDTRTVSSKSNGRFTFACLPICDSSGQEYTYTVDELSVPVGYRKTVENYNVINTILPGSMIIEGSKVWDDNDNATKKRPTDITVNLMQNGVKHDSQKVVSPADTEDTVLFNFKNVPRFDSEGKLFVYTVDEDDVAGYKKSIEDYDIINTLNNP